MTAEKKQALGNHTLFIDGREKSTVTGVSEVVKADANEIVLSTVLGRLIIKGKNLSIGTLNVESGELIFGGTVETAEYKENKKSGFARLFR